MTTLELDEVVEGVPALRGLFVTLMPDCLLFDSWMRPDGDWTPEDVASYFGDLVRANREGLKSLRSWSADMQVTIESADALVVLKELRGDFVVSFVFDRETPLGMVRLFVEAPGVEVPMDFDPDEADEIAEEIRAAARIARGPGPKKGGR